MQICSPCVNFSHLLISYSSEISPLMADKVSSNTPLSSAETNSLSDCTRLKISCNATNSVGVPTSDHNEPPAVNLSMTIYNSCTTAKIFERAAKTPRPNQRPNFFYKRPSAAQTALATIRAGKPNRKCRTIQR